MNSRTRILIGTMAAALVVSLIAGVQLLRQPHDRPEIQGALMQTPRELPAFTITDHHGEAFRDEDLTGDWQLLSYGFTHCPDICPLTMGTKAQLLERLRDEGQYGDMELLFYSVDPGRDTPEHLAEYVTHFHPEMLGLTSTDSPGETREVFERGLGLVHEIPEKETGGNYMVNHGLLMYLINPEGRLQAYFEPDVNPDGRISYSVDQLHEDYVAIRRHLERRGPDGGRLAGQ